MARKKAGSAQLSAVAKRFGITAREARDIAKAVSNAAVLAKTATKGKDTTTKGAVGQATRNIAKQVGETARAAATGKKGTRAGKIKTKLNEYPYSFKQGKKRK
jgi:hypothetical protein